jgi:vacuolar-type H+-ATPase subunit E/Vma4
MPEKIISTETHEVEEAEHETEVQAEREVGAALKDIENIKAELSNHSTKEELGSYQSWVQSEIARIESKPVEVPAEVLQKLEALGEKLEGMIASKDSSTVSSTEPPQRVETVEKPKPQATHFLHRFL